ncbi:hypothetical protein FB446DRAFT_623663, partial [Lentinula raphanica]
CHRCLGRDKHDVRRCSRTSFWNGEGKVLCNWNARRYLEITNGQHKGLELCGNWQSPNGCTESTHPQKHRCSGCAAPDHGADTCLKGE